jgi:hypothetical protein
MILLAYALLPAAIAAEPPTVTAVPGKGVTVTAADDRFSMSLRARFQLRQSLDVPAPDDDGARDVTMLTQLKTARFFITGHVLSPDIRYVTQWAVAPADFREGAISPVYDAYLDFTQSRDLSVRVGQAFVPFDRARTIREFALQLPERPKPVSELTLDRDVGAYLYSDHLLGDRSPVAYRVGLFGGSGIGQTNGHPPGGLAVARLELRPFGDVDDDSEGDLERREAPGLAVGVAGAANLGTTRQKSTTGTTYTDGTATYLHGAVDLVFKWQGVYLLAEGVVRDATEDAVVANDGTEQPTRSGWGWFVQPAVMVSPRVEVAARYGELRPFAGTDPAFKPVNELGAGTNLYLNGHRFKVQLGWTALYEEKPETAQHLVNLQVDSMF